VEVEVSSVNRKQFDLRLAMSKSLAALEPQITELVHKEISRGSITVAVNLVDSDPVKAGSIRVDSELARAYLKQIRKIAAGLGLKDDLTAKSLLSLPGVVEHAPVREGAAVWPIIKKALVQALKRFNSMRLAEGKAIAGDFAARLDRLETFLLAVKKEAPAITSAYRESLVGRLKKAGIETGEGGNRLMQEIAMFAERSDISEEIVRLESHMKQAGKMLVSAQPVGRSLDFLCQEMFREINTIGSKANSVEISRHVIAFKSELESVREQVQNVE
jgi:uncharacterized protein (TIGR00255 family)